MKPINGCAAIGSINKGVVGVQEKECDDLQDRVQLMLQRVTGAASNAPPKPPRSFDLLEIDDEDLTADQIKEKAVRTLSRNS